MDRVVLSALGQGFYDSVIVSNDDPEECAKACEFFAADLKLLDSRKQAWSIPKKRPHDFSEVPAIKNNRVSRAQKRIDVFVNPGLGGRRPAVDVFRTHTIRESVREGGLPDAICSLEDNDHDLTSFQTLFRE